MTKRQPTLLGRIAVILAILVIGVPSGLMLFAGTWGLIMLPAMIAFYAYPWFFLNSLLWGRRLEKKICGGESLDFWSGKSVESEMESN